MNSKKKVKNNEDEKKEKKFSKYSYWNVYIGNGMWTTGRKPMLLCTGIEGNDNGGPNHH